MKCTICGVWSHVLRTDDNRRRRECANEHRFTTLEVATEWVDLVLEQRAKLADRARMVLREKGILA